MKPVFVKSVLALVSAALLVGCAGPPATPRASTVGPGDAAPLPATAPYLTMTGPGTGWAVWPSGDAWLVLGTADGFAHIRNGTPVGVETNGGLVASPGSIRSAVAVLAHERLLRSPVLTAVAHQQWRPSELPGAVADSRAAVSTAPGHTSAITTASGGTLLEQVGSGWQVLARGDRLARNRALALDSVTWASSQIGWLTGHGRAGTPMAFRTSDGGRSWSPIAATAGRTVATLSPCGSRSAWLMPAISDNTLTVLRTTDEGAHWSAGAAVPLAAGEPAWGCHRAVTWVVSGTDRILSSADGGRHWTGRGRAPADLTDLTPTGGGTGFAASSGKTPVLWRVSGDGAAFTRISLPGWVATIGAQTSADD